MIDSDAGKYEVKLSSINYHSYSSSATYDRNVLRMLEQTALHASVTFYLQQYDISQYKPEDIMELYFLPVNSEANSNNTITIHYNSDVNATFLFGGYPRYFNQRFFRNGVYKYLNIDNVITEQSCNEINISHHLRYNDTGETVGHYVYMELSVIYRQTPVLSWNTIVTIIMIILMTIFPFSVFLFTTGILNISKTKKFY